MYIDESVLPSLKLMLEEKVEVISDEIEGGYAHVEIEIEDSCDISDLLYAGAHWGAERYKLINNHSI